MPWNFFCKRCDKKYSIEDYQTSQFCIECGSLIEKVRIEMINELKNNIPVLESEKLAIAKYIVENYAKEKKDFGDLEEKILKDIDVETVNGRFEVIILAILFSEYAMREERAYRLWRTITSWFGSRNLSYSDVLLGKDGKNIMEFKKLLNRIKAPSQLLDKITKTMINLENYDSDLNGLLADSNWRRTISRIQNKCAGVSQKAFWITRVIRQLGVWARARIKA